MDIVTSKQNGILTIEFNRPDKKNSITSAMYQTMADAIKDGETDPAVRVILFCGKPDVFSAGNDLEDFMNAGGAGVVSVNSIPEELIAAIKVVNGGGVWLSANLTEMVDYYLSLWTITCCSVAETDCSKCK